MFQATYVYFMLISTQYYFVSQARRKQALWEQGRLANGAGWDGAVWELVDEEGEEDWEDDEEAEEGEDADDAWEEEKTREISGF